MEFKKGDILCYKPKKDDIIGNIISFFSKGNYAHTSCYIGDGKIIESHIDTGVVEKELNPKWYPAIDIFRYQTLNTLQCNNIIKFLKYECGKGYDLPSFFETWIGILFGWTGIRKNKPLTNNPNVYYCSELVATAYNSVGIDITPNIHYMNVTPSDIGHSKVLIKIT